MRLPLPASTILALRERLRPGAATLQKQAVFNVGKLVTGVLYKILEVDPRRGVTSIGLRPGGDLIAVAQAPEADFLRALQTLRRRLQAFDGSKAEIDAVGRSLPSLSVDVQLTLPATDSQRLLDYAARRRFFRQPGLTRWRRGSGTLPASLAGLAPLKVDFVASQGQTWLLACWRERPGPRHVLCRLDFPLVRRSSSRAHLARVVKRWGRPAPSTSPVRPRFYGDQDLALLMNAAGVAAVVDGMRIQGALKTLREFKPTERKDAATYFAATIDLASRFVSEDSNLLTTVLWLIHEKAGVLHGDVRWRMTPKGKRVMAPVVKAAGSKNLFEGSAWADRLVKPLRARLQRDVPPRGLYTLKGEELLQALKRRGLDTLVPLLAMARTWPDLIRLSGIGERFNHFADSFKNQGFTTLRVSVQGDDLVWHMEQPIPGKAPRPR